MKKIALMASAAVISCAALNAAPLFTIGDQVDVFFNGSVKGGWDSNMFMKSTDKIDDYYYTFRLGGEANYGRNSKFNASIRFYEDLVRYVTQTHSDVNLSNVFANASYAEERWSVATNFSFVQVAQNNETMFNNQNILVRRDIYTAAIKGAYDFTDKLNGELGFSWYREAFRDQRDLYSDRDTYAVPVSLLYRITDKINAGLTYQYRTTEYSGGNASSAASFGSHVDDHFAGLTVRGELFPKLAAEVSLGYAFRDLKDIDRTENTFSYSIRLDYEVTDKLTTFLYTFRDFGNGAARQSAINTGVRVGANYAFSEYIKAFGSFGYTFSEFEVNSNREDNWFSYNVGVSYIPNRFITLSAVYTYWDNDSNQNGSSYSRHLIGLDFSVRY